MKTQIVKSLHRCIVASALLMLTGWTGCNSTPNPNGNLIIVDQSNGELSIGGIDVPPSVVGSTISTAIRLGLSYATLDTNTVAYIQDAALAINLVISTNGVDPAALQAAIAQIPINAGASTALIQSLITTAIQDYSTYYAAVTAAKIANVNPYLLPIVQGIADGLSTATPKLSIAAVKVDRSQIAPKLDAKLKLLK